MGRPTLTLTDPTLSTTMVPTPPTPLTTASSVESVRQRLRLRPNPNTWPTETTMVPDTPLMLPMVPTTTLLPTLMEPTPTATPLMEAVTCTSVWLRLKPNPNTTLA